MNQLSPEVWNDKIQKEMWHFIAVQNTTLGLDAFDWFWIGLTVCGLVWWASLLWYMWAKNRNDNDWLDGQGRKINEMGQGHKPFGCRKCGIWFEDAHGYIDHYRKVHEKKKHEHLE